MVLYRQAGGRLAAFVRSQNPSRQQVCGLLSDLLVGDELLLPMRDLASRPCFSALQPLAGTGGGAIQRDACLQELSKTYLPSVVDDIAELINGFLDLPKAPGIDQSSPLSLREIPPPPFPVESPSPSEFTSSRECTVETHAVAWGCPEYADDTSHIPSRPIETPSFAVRPRLVSASDLAKELKMPVGHLISWCVRTGYPSKAHMHPGSMLTDRQALEIRRTLRNIRPQTFFDFIGFVVILLLIAIFLIGILSRLSGG